MIDTPTTPEKIIEAAMMANTQRKNMTTQELRELDAWIAEHVMGWAVHFRNTAFYVDKENKNKITGVVKAAISDWKPTIYPEDAMQVLEKCGEKVVFIGYKHQEIWSFASNFAPHHQALAPTLPLAICLFAKQLFSK